MTHTIYNAIQIHKISVCTRINGCRAKNVTRPTVSLEPFRKIIIDLIPLSKFSDKITFIIDFQNGSKHCKIYQVDINYWMISYHGHVSYTQIFLTHS